MIVTCGDIQFTTKADVTIEIDGSIFIIRADEIHRGLLDVNTIKHRVMVHPLAANHIQLEVDK